MPLQAVDLQSLGHTCVERGGHLTGASGTLVWSKRHTSVDQTQLNKSEQQTHPGVSATQVWTKRNANAPFLHFNQGICENRTAFAFYLCLN